MPYRDSKLTSLLKQNIGGNNFCMIIACLAPLASYIEEYISTITYADSLHFQRACEEYRPKSKVVGSLKAEKAQLKAEMSEVYCEIDMLTKLLMLDRAQ